MLGFSWLKRQFLARGIIVPFRYKKSAEQYRQLWTKEGSPLLVHSQSTKEKLQVLLGDRFTVSLAMRYQNPSIATALNELKEAGLSQIIVLPLFPQYASATTGSVHQEVMERVKNWHNLPKLTFINSYPTHQLLVEAFCARGRQYDIDSYDHILFSFHGLPERQIKEGGCPQACPKGGCCQKIDQTNPFCYKAQCYATAHAIAKKLGVKGEVYSVSFQSRLGKEPWIQPYTSDVIKIGAERGWKKVLVFCPSFVCDCLETTFEITHEYGKEFKAYGGEDLQLVEGLNAHPIWIDALRAITLENC